MSDPLPTGSTIGILGGGQLGRMLSLAAARIGIRTHIFEPGENCPASAVAAACTTASYDDADALRAFATSVNVVTYEFENVPTSALDLIEETVAIRPGRRALATSQDRLEEKKFLREIGLETAPFAIADTIGDLAAALPTTGLPALLKTRRFGYDGKGQVRLDDAVHADQALAKLDGASAILEGIIPFDKEISVIAARSVDGDVVAYDPGENVHEGGILRTTKVPGTVTPAEARDAREIARTILDALDYVGVMGVELFVQSNRLLVNEFAPRVHNSGHWTMNGCAIDQFEQHIRAVAGWPLGDGSRYADVEMENLIGDDIARLTALSQEGCALHLYGKAEVRGGRKMGHVNRPSPRTS